MKRLFLFMTVLTMVLFAGCQKEEGIEPVEPKLTVESLEQEFDVKFSDTNDSEFTAIPVTLEELREILQTMKQSDNTVDTKVGPLTLKPEGYTWGKVYTYGNVGPDGYYWKYSLDARNMNIGGAYIDADVSFNPRTSMFSIVLYNTKTGLPIFTSASVKGGIDRNQPYPSFKVTVPCYYTYMVSGTNPTYIKVDFDAVVRWIDKYLIGFSFSWYNLVVKNTSTPN